MPAAPRGICTDRYISFHTFTLPLGVLVNSRLGTLRAKQSYGYNGRAQFYFKSGQSFFKLHRSFNSCVVYTKRNLIHPGNYDVEIYADVVDRRGQLICRTVFKLFINVGKYQF